MTELDIGAPARLREAMAAELALARRGGSRSGYPDPQVVARRLAETVQMRQDSAELLLARGLHEATPGRWDWRADGRLRLPSRLRMTEAQVEAFLRAIACPTLLLRAEPGMPADDAYFAERLGWIADLSRVVRSGGHHLHLDEPGTVAAVVGPFLLGA